MFLLFRFLFTKMMKVLKNCIENHPLKFHRQKNKKNIQL